MTSLVRTLCAWMLLMCAPWLAGCVHDEVRVANPAATQVSPPPLKPRALESEPMRFLAALELAESVQIVSLSSREAELLRRSHVDRGKAGRGSDQWYASNEAELDAAWCATPDACLEGNRVLGRVAVDEGEGRRALVEHMRGWLAFEPAVDFGCIAEYRHAVEFVTAGTRHRLLLCYDCRMFWMRDGARSGTSADPFEGTGSAGRAMGHAWFAERFAAAGIPVEERRR
jgi:hypothetical protein